jgi:hypothetical protein
LEWTLLNTTDSQNYFCKHEPLLISLRVSTFIVTFLPLIPICIAFQADQRNRWDPEQTEQWIERAYFLYQICSAILCSVSRLLMEAKPIILEESSIHRSSILLHCHHILDVWDDLLEIWL